MLPAPAQAEDIVNQGIAFIGVGRMGGRMTSAC